MGYGDSLVTYPQLSIEHYSQNNLEQLSMASCNFVVLLFVLNSNSKICSFWS